MSSPRQMPLLRQVSLFVFVVLLAVSAVGAQSNNAFNPGNLLALSSNESSSNTFGFVDGSPVTSWALPAAPAASGAAGGQYSDKHKFMSLSHMAFDLGGGFSGPVGNDRPYITWGGNFNFGAGLHFTKRFAVLGEFEFLDNKLPGAFIAAAGQGATGGNSHIISLTAQPVFDLFPNRINSIYLTAGGGFYHKSTNFTVLQCCDFYGYPVSIDTNSFASNQAGGNLGLGFTHRLGGVNGDGQMKLYGQVRYLYLKTPPITQINGLGTTALIPVTFGIRW